MERFAFSLDEGAKKWLKDRSDELDISRAELLRRLIAHGRECDTTVIHGDTDGDTHSDTVADTVAEHAGRLAELEARVEELEAEVDDENRPETAEMPNMADNQPREGRSSGREPRGNDAETGGAELQTIVDDLGEEVLPGSGEKLEERKAALLAAVKYLTSNGSATRADFSEEVYPEHTGRYESAYSWWKNCILPALGEFADRTDVVEAADHSGVWEYHPSIPDRV
jgi:hypothetical protein